MAYTLTVGSIRCHILSDGLHVVDGGALFGVVPRVLWERVLMPNAQNQAPFDARSLLIESDAGLILVDGGYGDKIPQKQRRILQIGDRTERLLDDMRSVGFDAADVAIVLMTHLHADHVGGCTRFDTPDHSPGPLVPTFPNARYICQRLDLAEASFPNERTAATFHAENWEPLLTRNVLEVVAGPQRLATGVRTQIAPGHTAALQVVWVEDGGESLLFLGDAANCAVQLDRLAWVPSFDIFPLTSMETKRTLIDEAMASDALLIFQHDPVHVTGRLVVGERGPRVETEIREEPWVDPAGRRLNGADSV
ncbi:MAG: MBL fold metallo-hydrolase [Caldilineaceae bacterium]|nr:MBL fold metallo-hydrolase [Caldilineaceae bacterium]